MLGELKRREREANSTLARDESNEQAAKDLAGAVGEGCAVREGCAVGGVSGTFFVLPLRVQCPFESALSYLFHNLYIFYLRRLCPVSAPLWVPIKSSVSLGFETS